MRKILLSTLVCASIGVCAQGILELPLDGSERGKSLASFLGRIEGEGVARFYFLPGWLEPIQFQRAYTGQTLGQALDDLLRNTGLSYVRIYPDVIVFIKDPTLAILRDQALERAHSANKKIGRYEFGEPGQPQSGPVRISGQVRDSRTGEPMAHTNIRVSDTRFGATTGDQGTYVLSLPPGGYVLQFSCVDYEDQVIDLGAYANGTIDVNMEEVPTMLGEVIIQDDRTPEVATARIGQRLLMIPDIKRAPSLLGEADVIRQVQTLPGVTTVGESASGFNVRGGSVDQNLILYDGLPVFNSAHAFGFLSAFNPMAIRDVSFYRGGIPAEYGGRASSVLDIQSSDGDFHKWHIDASVGMITTGLMVDGPLRKDKTSLAVSLRSSYSNWLVHSIRTNYADLRNSSVFFYDGTAKLTHRLTDRTRISLTTYSSRDAFRLIGDSTYQWSNFLTSAILDHQFSPRLNIQVVGGTSVYGYRLINGEYSTASELAYRVSASLLRFGFSYQKGNHRVRGGWQELFYRFDPGSLMPRSSASNARRVSLEKQNALESAIYVSDEWSPLENVFVEAGLRVPQFVSFGPASLALYEDGRPRDAGSVIDTLHFTWGKPVKTYAGVEPRLSLRWMTGADGAVKIGYNRLYQFLHLVTNTAAVSPVDIWQPSGYYFRPQHVDEVSAGYFRDPGENRYSLSAEVFYKAFSNILDFKNGAQLVLNPHLETELLQGRGRAYGVEATAAKNRGRLKGSVNYTWSRALRQMAGPTPDESVNRGRPYPASYDQPHILNLSWQYNVSRRYSVTGDFTYHSGRPVTIPLSAFSLEHMNVAYFSARNQYRIPDYHRLDLALVIEGSNRKAKQSHATWVVSVYNVYARKNPYTVFFKSTASGIPKPYQLSIIGTVLPSVSYNLRF